MDGERKQVTVLFADVVGSMELAERSDPEDWRSLMAEFVSVLSEGVHRFEGTVDKFTGDGIMALFGAPVAQEDHARRACLAALDLQREIAGLSLPVRIGLNSGEVVVGAIGDDAGMAYTAVGHTVGLAKRMEQLAEPGTIYVTQHTASLVEGYVALTDLGDFGVSGVSRPLRVHELTGTGTASGRLDVSRARGFSRFVGRDEELRLLEDAAGAGQVIAVVGEAGVGKSRLCHEFAERRRAGGAPVYHVAGQAHATAVPLRPVLRLLRAYLEIGEQDSDRVARERIAGKLDLLDERFDDDLPLLLDFLAISDPDHAAPRMNPEARQRRLLELVERVIGGQSARAPGVTLVEDLHWLDPASEAFLASLIEAVRGTPSTVVLNFRPEYDATWMSASCNVEIALAPLAPAAIELLLGDLAGTDPSLDGLSELIRERTQGNPFFVEELVRSLVEDGSLEGTPGAYRLVRSVDDDAVPAGVQAVLAARIDRLAPTAKAVLQAAAVIGKEFPRAVLEPVVALAPGELDAALRALAAGEFVHEQTSGLAFKHPLTREVAYGSQLRSQRGPVHAAVARAIAERYPERLDERAALLAQHWEAAGEALEAARWHARAAAWSGYNHPAQALPHWRKVSALTDDLPEAAETAALGLRARIFTLQLGWRLGISTEEAQALFDEADRMALKAGDIRSRALLHLTYGGVKGLGEGDMRAYADLARRAFALAEESGDPALYIVLAPAAFAFFATGEHREGVAALDRAIELADGDAAAGAGITVACPVAYCHAVKGLNLAFLGELDAARALIEEGRRIARAEGDVETVALSHMYSTWLAYYDGEPESALGHAQQALELAERIGGSFSRVYAWLFLGVALGMRGEWRQAVEALERSLEIAREVQEDADGGGLLLALLGESHARLGDAQRARALAAEGVAISRERGQVSNETYASLALARILLGSAGVAARTEIEAALARTLELVCQTGAKVFEPLVHVELAELARQSGDAARCERELDEAERMFTEIGARGLSRRHAGSPGSPASTT